MFSEISEQIQDLMTMREDQEKVKALLTEAISVLCKNGLSYREEFTIEGLLGITLDNEDVFLVNINEHIKSEVSTPMPSRAVGGRVSPTRMPGISPAKMTPGGRAPQQKPRKRPFPGGTDGAAGESGQIPAEPKAKKQQPSSVHSPKGSITIADGKRFRPINRAEKINFLSWVAVGKFSSGSDC